jgi:membrane protein implicated in regulation of membrane protease activity
LNKRAAVLRERERPGPSVIWQTLAVTFGGFAFAAALGALTIAGKAAVRPGELWVAAAGFFLAAVLCLAAHRDVNRGRKSRWIEVEELPSRTGAGEHDRRAG